MDVRLTAIQQLAKGWTDDLDTLPILKTSARSDDSSYVRREVLRQIAKGWTDEPGVFEFLCDRAINDPFKGEDLWLNPRWAAFQVIIERYGDHPQTLPLCKDRAENDPDEKVREFAKNKLAELEK